MRDHRIGRGERAASEDDSLCDRRVGRDPSPLANLNRPETRCAKAIGPLESGMVSGDQHSVRPELHLILQDDASPGVQPAARPDKNIAANFQAIRKIDGHIPRDLKVRATTFERGSQQ